MRWNRLNTYTRKIGVYEQKKKKTSAEKWTTCIILGTEVANMKKYPRTALSSQCWPTAVRSPYQPNTRPSAGVQGNVWNQTKTVRLYSLGVDGGDCVDGLRSSSTAYGSSDLQRHYYRAAVGHFIDIVLCGKRRTGSRVLAPVRAYVSAAVTTTTKLYRKTDRIRRNVYGRCVITPSADSGLSVSTISFIIP